MNKKFDLQGQKFERLTVVRFAGKDKNNAFMWECKCECGKTTIVRGASLRSGVTQSCGCLRQDHIVESVKKHGDSESRLYLIWRKMKNRCEGKTSDEKIIKNYRDRGIKVCPEWHDYFAFKEWSLNNGYKDDLTIDRINNDGNYEPSNCRWTNRKIQMNNTRRCVLFTYNNETLTIKQWADKKGVPYEVLRTRLQIKKWPIQKALEEPVRIRRVTA